MALLKQAVERTLDTEIVTYLKALSLLFYDLTDLTKLYLVTVLYLP